MQMINSLPDLNSYIGFVVLSAPDRFPRVGPFSEDQRANVTHAFEQLSSAMTLVETMIGDKARVEQLHGLLRAARLCYLEGEKLKGAHLLQDFQDMLFPDRFKDSEPSET
jgi:hypothetical protein